MSEASSISVPSAPQSDEPVVDYFSFRASEKFYLPDGEQWIEFEKMNEGAKKKFQDKTSKDMVLDRTGGARMTILQGSERHELIKACVTNFHLRRGSEWLDMNAQEGRGKVQFGDFLELGDPTIIEDLEKAIRKANPWLMSELSVQDIDREIENLQEMREIAVKRESGEGS